MFGRDSRFRLFLAFLILVLVLVNTQSLQLSTETRALITESFERAARAEAQLIAAEIADARGESALLQEALHEAAARHGLLSACLLDWNARLLTGGDCEPPRGEAFDRLDRDERRRLLEESWVVTDVVPAYDPIEARATGYLVAGDDVLRIEARARAVAEANRSFRSTIIYQVSALSLVLLAMMLFVHSLLGPQKRLVAEARTVASELKSESGSGPVTTRDEGEFLLGTFQEVVSRLKLKEQELEALHRLEKARADRSEALASDIIRSMTTGLVSLDPSGSVAVVNPAAERILGVAEADCLGRAFADAFTGSTELSTYVDDALTSGSSRLRGQVRYAKPPEGKTLHLGVSVIPLLSPDGRAQGALCLAADLTEVVELRERLLLKDNLARLGEMAAGIAHEFRNALATILGNAKLLRGALEGEPREIAEALIDESQALAHVVTEFLQFARPDALATDAIALDELADSVVEEHRDRARECGVSLVREGDPVRLVGDERLLRKAVSNLIANAIDSFGQDSSAMEFPKTVEVETGFADDHAVLRVSDNGPGIDPQDRERIFTPFFTRKETGTGLGLSVVQKVVVLHNGTIDLESRKRGTSFVVRLPLAPTQASVAPAWL